MEAKDIIIRAHQLGSIMGGPKEKAGELSKTTQKELIKIYAAHLMGVSQSMTSKYLEKGIEAEEDSITLKSKHDKRFYTKNTERKKDAYFSGECDIIDGDTIHDIKSSWSLESHLLKRVDKLNPDYFWQGQVYMHLYGATNYSVCHCLVNTPDYLTAKEQQTFLYKIGAKPERYHLYETELEEIAKGMIFDHLPIELRYFEQRFEFDPQAIETAKARIDVCRNWIINNLVK
jgi:hypothetical protein